MQKTWILIICILISVGYLTGVYTVVNQTFPYSNLKSFYKQITFDENEIEYDVDIKSLIHINSIEDVNNTRVQLIDYIWSHKGLPNNLPNSIQENFNDKRYDDLENLKEIEKIEVVMDYGINSIAYLFVSEESNNEVIIYHQGHSGDFINGIETIQFFLKNDYSVLAFSMPLLGMNNQPTVQLDHLGKIHLNNHASFRFLENEKLTPIKFYVEPIFVSINYLDQNYSFTSYHMVGISGGGWTAVLYPSIDERISQTFSVAGSYPIYIKSERGLLGDYEQSMPELYEIANYFDLYVLDSYGNDRKFVQIFNKFDPCCYWGTAFQSYETELKEKIILLQPSEFKIFLDDSHSKHIISEKMLQLILKEIKNET